MFLFISKVIISFIIYQFFIRILGKTALAQLTGNDIGAIFFLAYLLFGSIEIKGTLQSVVGCIIVTCLYFLISKISLNNKLNKFLIGEPVFLIKNGKIMAQNLRRSRYTLMELLSSIRVAGYFDINDVDYALIEPNGDISVLAKKDKVYVTPSHLDINTSDMGLPLAVIIDGEIQDNNLKELNKDKGWLKRELQLKGYSQLNKIFLATVTINDHLLKVHTND